MSLLTFFSNIRSHGGVCESLSAFWIELRHVNFSPGLQRMEAVEGSCQALGWGLASCEVIKDLALCSKTLCYSGFALNNTFGPCIPLYLLENFYK
jgi:hypothetical protein